MNGFLKGLTAGAVIGATAGLMMMPMDRKTRKRIIKSRKNAIHKAENIMDSVMGMMM